MPPNEMSLTHYWFNDYPSSFERLLDDVLSNRGYRQGQQSDIFRPR